MIKVKVKGSYKKVYGHMEKLLELFNAGKLNKYGEMGVRALMQNTPIDTGKTASSWSYEIERTNNKVSIVFTNSNVNDLVNIAIILQYGHGLEDGGWVEGVDYINPAIANAFNAIIEDIQKEVER